MYLFIKEKTHLNKFFFFLFGLKPMKFILEPYYFPCHTGKTVLSAEGYVLLKSSIL